MTTLKQTIDQVLELIVNPCHYCTGCTARTKTGAPCDPCSPRAAQWSVYGAIEKVGGAYDTSLFLLIGNEIGADVAHLYEPVASWSDRVKWSEAVRVLTRISGGVS